MGKIARHLSKSSGITPARFSMSAFSSAHSPSRWRLHVIDAENFAVCGLFRVSTDATGAYLREFRGIAVAPSGVVNTRAIDPTPASEILHAPTTFGRWTLLRKGRMITCEITVCRHSFDVCVITHWDAALSVIEAYETPASALARHEDIVSALRRAGWMRVSEAVTGDLTAA
jgi:hypothetical protein